MTVVAESSGDGWFGSPTTCAGERGGGGPGMPTRSGFRRASDAAVTVVLVAMTVLAAASTATASGTPTACGTTTIPPATTGCELNGP
jgi:hypothetical protein